jgi:DNA helicase HerA-like ATPase
MIKGQIISGEFGKILVRQKSDKSLELGELLVAETKDNQNIIMQVYSLSYGSQISQQNLELISGIKLEEDNDVEIFDQNLRNYTLAFLKPLVSANNGKFQLCKTLPSFFSSVREITAQDLSFMTKPDDALTIGKIRSGSKLMDIDVSLPGREVLSHHILIPGTTGKGKSVLIKNILWNSVGKDYCAFLVLDPHDEYYGRNNFGLKDHPEALSKISYYTTKSPPVGAKTLKINLSAIKPHHFNGVVEFSDPQQQALILYHKEFGNRWIEALIIGNKLKTVEFREETLAVVRRRLLTILDLEFANNQLSCDSVFDISAGESTISNICKELETSKTVIIDTSNFSGTAELLIGSLITTEIFNTYRHYKMRGLLDSKPVISIVLEEAPRVLGKEVLEKGSNIFATIAREGRKFQVGLTAITQLPSLIPRQILANMNTKIILGIEMKPERQAIIESAAQDLSEDDRTIASLDKGEALISSNFLKFATPIKIPMFESIIKTKPKAYKKDFSALS